MINKDFFSIGPLAKRAVASFPAQNICIYLRENEKCSPVSVRIDMEISHLEIPVRANFHLFSGGICAARRNFSGSDLSHLTAILMSVGKGKFYFPEFLTAVDRMGSNASCVESFVLVRISRHFYICLLLEALNFNYYNLLLFILFINLILLISYVH